MKAWSRLLRRGERKKKKRKRGGWEKRRRGELGEAHTNRKGKTGQRACANKPERGGSRSPGPCRQEIFHFEGRFTPCSSRFPAWWI
jgi:hypothetical protein